MIELKRKLVPRLLGITPAAFAVRADQATLPLAWGAPLAAAGKLLAIDVAIIRFGEELGKMVGCADATAIMMAHFDHCAETISRSEFDPEGRTFYLAVAVAGSEAKRDYLIASGLPEEILADINGAVPPFPHHRVCTVNVTLVLADLRERARAIGLDLSAPFFLPADHPQFRELIEGAADMRRELLAALKRDDPAKFAKRVREPLGRVLQ
jgi:hypothetical protein